MSSDKTYGVIHAYREDVDFFVVNIVCGEAILKPLGYDG
jgi:hypothetical protein